MKTMKALSLLFVIVGLMIACQKENQEPVQKIREQGSEFTVPEIPDEIAALMSEEQIALFKAGPGEEYLNDNTLKCFRLKKGRWHPVLMKLGYHLQFWPVSSCDPETAAPCIDQYGHPTGACGEGPAGFAGITVADGYWFSKQVHSEYYPVFCLPDMSGVGTGFYRTDKGSLFIEATSDPYIYDEERNIVFLRKGHYSADRSTGIYKGAAGWEYAIVYTAAENSPENDPGGRGYGEAVIFGWVYY